MPTKPKPVALPEAPKKSAPLLSGLAPLVRDSLSGMAYEQIRAALMSSQLRPGQRLVLRALAAELGISPTPVREALLRLVSEHVLELDARGIVCVPELDLATYVEIRDLRIELEGRAAAAAALYATPEDIAALTKIHDRFLAAEAKGDAHAAGEANEELHATIYRLARMPVLLTLIEILREKMQELFPITSDTSLKVTIAKWLTPKGISISEKGITPDYVITEPTGAVVGTPTDLQMAKAVSLLTGSN